MSCFSFPAHAPCSHRPHAPALFLASVFSLPHVPALLTSCALPSYHFLIPLPCTSCLPPRPLPCQYLCSNLVLHILLVLVIVLPQKPFISFLPMTRFTTEAVFNVQVLRAKVLVHLAVFLVGNATTAVFAQPGCMRMMVLV